MPSNNNQKVQSAAARLAKLPVVRSACTQLSVLYIDTKCSHPNLRSVCDVLESSVTAVIVRLEPQLSIANGVACRSLDWLETAFPVIHTPTEQIVASARNKMHEIQDVVSIAAHGTMGCVEHTVAWVTGSVQQADDQTGQSLVERALSVACVGLDSALVTSEALMDRMLPATEEDKGHREFVQVYWCSSGKQLAELDLEHPGAASVPAASACVCIVLHLPDVQLRPPRIVSG
ncbi:perilipin-2-like [Cyclopterus lumpus]|uniref:perilipin-2-like n=1 Tax=Cyclopterus lumpus TaxID=8103 RepID=UPI0014870017|nr:perilipin-2-like [Cyclopterus lumpus]